MAGAEEGRRREERKGGGPRQNLATPTQRVGKNGVLEGSRLDFGGTCRARFWRVSGLALQAARRIYIIKYLFWYALGKGLAAFPIKDP